MPAIVPETGGDEHLFWRNPPGALPEPARISLGQLLLGESFRLRPRRNCLFCLRGFGGGWQQRGPLHRIQNKSQVVAIRVWGGMNFHAEDRRVRQEHLLYVVVPFLRGLERHPLVGHSDDPIYEVRSPINRQQFDDRVAAAELCAKRLNCLRENLFKESPVERQSLLLWRRSRWHNARRQVENTLRLGHVA